MQFLIVIALGVSIFFGLDSISRRTVPTPDDIRANRVAMAVDLLAVGARNYVDMNPSATGTFYWGTLRKFVGGSMKTDSVPAHWRAVVYEPGKFVLCTQVTSTDEANIMQSRPLIDIKLKRHSTRENMVVSGETMTVVESKEGLCTSGS